MSERQDILDEIYRLIYDQTQALGSRLTEEQAITCKIRAERIGSLLARIKRENTRTNRPSPWSIPRNSHAYPSTSNTSSLSSNPSAVASRASRMCLRVAAKCSKRSI